MRCGTELLVYLFLLFLDTNERKLLVYYDFSGVFFGNDERRSIVDATVVVDICLAFLFGLGSDSAFVTTLSGEWSGSTHMNTNPTIHPITFDASFEQVHGSVQLLPLVFQNVQIWLE